MMPRARLSPLLLTVLFATGPAAAAGIVDGTYGDKEGCLYATTGESSGADIFFLLNAEGVTTAVSYCAFQGEGQQVGGAVRVKADCREEGSPDPAPTELTLTPDNGGFTVGLEDGTRWGPLMRCAP